ncbi:c-type cytochrome biogenesis protein CcmI [Dokdonella sp.]|uniref:c-type cytochrome biogenesis protein CcmI n=1 Tax=Dokdonella sp. TaxID=2291710 RepID=UPI003784A414
MAMFVVCVALMIATALAFVLVPLLRHRSGATDPAARRLRALDQALAAGVIDADEHARKREVLVASSAEATPARPSRGAFAALLLVALLLPASALLLYRLVGAPQALDPANVAAAPADEHGPDMQKAIEALAARLAQQPDDVEGWALLARAYQATGRTQESLDAYRHAHELAKDNPAVTVEYAQALAVVAPDHRIQGESRDLLEGVLKVDASNQRALWLLGISDYQAGHYDAAIARWNTLMPLLEAGSEVAASVKQQIAEAEAKRDGKETPAPMRPPARESSQGIAASAAPTKDTAASGTAAAAPRLTVQVSLDPKLAGKLDADATLFVFARAASGPPMPLAIQRLKASQLPLTVTLDESMGMLPNMKLSMFPQVVVGARISKSGNALPQSGDLQVLSAPLDVHRSEPLALAIDQVVP